MKRKNQSLKVKARTVQDLLTADNVNQAIETLSKNRAHIVKVLAFVEYRDGTNELVTNDLDTGCCLLILEKAKAYVLCEDADKE